jgi:hypothetical protein
VFGHGPHQADQCTGHGSHDVVGVCAARHEVSIAWAQAPLGLPAEVLDCFGWCFASQLPVSTHVGGIVISPSAFHESPTGMGVPGVGERTLPELRATGIGGRRGAQARHQLSGGSDAREVAECGPGRDRHGAVHPPQGLEGCDDRRQPPGGDLLVECLCQALETCGVCVDGADVCLEDHWLSRCGADHLAEPPEVGRAPGRPARVLNIMPEPEGLQTTLSRLEITAGVCTSAGEVAERFIVQPGKRDGGPITRAHQAGQWDGVTAVGVHPVARLFRDQRRRHHPAPMAFFGKVALAPGAPGTGCIDKDKG